jgi:hypothetical protein
LQMRVKVEVRRKKTISSGKTPPTEVVNGRKRPDGVESFLSVQKKSLSTLNR